MSNAFFRGQQLGRNDLKIFLTNAGGVPTTPAEISYALFDVTTGKEALVGATKRTPANPSMGEYYASVIVPLDANLGLYRVRWSFRELVSSPMQQVVQEFEVIDKVTAGAYVSPGMTSTEADLARRLRILLRDHQPDRHYHFRPPAHEETITQFNQVFGHIWEDEELQEYLLRSLDMISASPPRTPFGSIEQMVQQYPEWRTMLLTGAMSFAIQALKLNWIADEFSVAAETEVRVILPDGQEVDVAIGALYDECKESQDTPSRLCKAFQSGSLRVRSVPKGTTDVVHALVSDVLRHASERKSIVQIALADGRRVVTTLDHSLFRLEDGLPRATKASDLRVGDVAVVVDVGRVVPVKVASVEETLARPFMYDLSVPGPENFVLSNGILAHNSYSIGGVSLDIEKSSKYESAQQSASEQFDKQLEQAKQTVKVIRGLQQPRYGMGIRSSFGPYVGRGVLTPRKFVG